MQAFPFPGLGELVLAEHDWYASPPVELPLYGGRRVTFVVEDYAEDPRPEEMHAAVANFLALDPATLAAASGPVFDFYRDVVRLAGLDDDPNFEPVASADEVCEQVQLGGEIHVVRRSRGDRGVYISIECECDWEPEHGLQLVFKNGERVSRVSEFDGDLVNENESNIYERFGGP